MKKLFIILIFLIPAVLHAQLSRVPVKRVTNATTVFSESIAVGTQIYDMNAERLYIATEGVVSTGTLSNNSSSFLYLEDIDWDLMDNSYLDRSAWNGTFQESFNAYVSSNGTVLTMSLQSVLSGDLTMQFSDGLLVLDCDPAKTIELTEGTATSPQSNYVYIPRSSKVLTLSTTGWPSTEHIKVSYFLVQDATTVQNSGALINQNWNDELSNPIDNMGHITHIGQWVRSRGANWFSGCDGGGTGGEYINLYAGGGTFHVNAGVIMQMHKHSYTAKNTSTTDEAHCANYPSEAFKTVTDLNEMLIDALGGSLTGRYYNIIIAGVANKGGEYSPLMIKLPQGSYNSSENAIKDIDGYDNYQMPREFNKESSTGFLIARITIRNQGDATFTIENTQDLRGLIGATASGSTGGTTLMEYSDSQFRIYNNINATKVVSFDVSGVTAGNTRAMGIPDEDGTLALEENIIDWEVNQETAHVIHVGNYVDNVDDADASITNEIQDISGSVLTGTLLTIGIDGGSNEDVELSSLQDGTGSDTQDLSWNSGTHSVDITTGSDAVIPIASTSVIGLLPTAKWDEIVVNNGKISYTDASDVGSNTSFRTTPSTIITAGSNLTWDGNILNATGDGTGTDSQTLTWTDGTDNLAISGGNNVTIDGFAPSLGADDNYVTDSELTIVQATSGANSGDNATNTQYSGLVTNANHTDEVTGSGALTITDNVVDEANLKISNTPSNGDYLQYADGTDQLTWDAITGGGNVSNTGTPVNNQVAIWTDATTLEGDADLTFDGTDLLIGGDIKAKTQTNTVLNGSQTADFSHDAASGDIGAYQVNKGSLTLSIHNLSSGMQGTIFLDFHTTTVTGLTVNTFSDAGSTGLTEIVLGSASAPAINLMTSVTYTCAYDGTNTYVALVYGQEE